MDPRIEQKLLELRQKVEQEKLWQKRIDYSLKQLNIFMRINIEGIKEIFMLNKATYLTFYTDRGNDRYLCYSPNDGFHIRIFGSRDIESKFSSFRKLVVDFGERSGGPEELTDSFAQSLLNDTEYEIEE